MPIRQKISSIVEQAATAKTPEEKIHILRYHDHPALRGYLGMTIDPNCKWALPPGAPPFKPCALPNVEMALYNEFRRMYIFIEGKYPGLKSGRRETLFGTLLEALDPKDAEFLINVVKDKKLPKGLTPKIIKEAFPNL